MDRVVCKSAFWVLFFCLTCFAQSLVAQRPNTNKDIEQQLVESVDFGRFKFHLEKICQEPHPAGSAANERVRDYMAEVMNNAGWDTKIHRYDVYLAPEPGRSSLALVTPIRMPLNQQEYIVAEDPYSGHPALDKGWNAWSGSGDVTAEVVYVNYGRKEDFDWLAAQGISLEGKIAIARYGGNFRGYKAQFAQQYGAVGLVIFTDPADAGYMRGLTYPEGPHFDESSIQRGSLLTLDWVGDPLTPGWAAMPTEDIERLAPESLPLHHIPVLPIGYGAAKEILGRMKGEAVPRGWQGGLPFTYRIQGGSELSIRMQVEQERKITPIYNVVGMLPGTTYPDEWIVLGSHYDAWTFGAADPNSGTALLLSMAETLGKWYQQGIRPERSILIAHWDAEEHGLFGSTEWVEEHRALLLQGARAYINLDAAVTGRNFSASASPSLKQVVLDASRMVPFPDSAANLYEVWSNRFKGKEEPVMGDLGGGSDHVGFYMHAAVPSMSLGSGGPYLYHTNYDNLHYYERFCDPDFVMGGMMEQLCLLISWRLANEKRVPYSPERYATDFRKHLDQVEQKLQGDASASIVLTATREALDKLDETFHAYQQWLTATDRHWDAAQMQAINQVTRDMETCFLHEAGMPFSTWYQSLFASSDPFSGYSSWLLPALTYYANTNQPEEALRWDEIHADALRCLEAKVRGIMGE